MELKYFGKNRKKLAEISFEKLAVTKEAYENLVKVDFFVGKGTDFNLKTPKYVKVKEHKRNF